MKKSYNEENDDIENISGDNTDELTDDEVSSAENAPENNPKIKYKSLEDAINNTKESDRSYARKKAKEDEPSAPAKDIPKNRKMIIFEIALALLAIIVIIVAIAIKKKEPKNPDSAASPDEINITTGEPGSELSEIDNSILFAGVPEVPAMVQNDSLDYEALVAENKMIKLKGSEGQDVYVHNYHNSDYFNKETKLNEDEVDKTIAKNVLAGSLEPVAVNRDTAEMYDTVSINYLGTMDGVAFEGGAANDQEVTIGISAYIDGFTEGIVGMKVGETKDVHVTFPEDYGSADLAGKPAVFKITLNQIITANKVPELTDELVSNITNGELKSASELRKNIRNNLLAVRIWDFIDTDFYLSSLSEESVKAYYDKMIQQVDSSSQQYQMSAEMLINQYYNMDVEAYKKQTMTDSVENMRHSILYNAIADKEGITVSEDDIAKLAADYGYADKVDEFKSSYGEDIIHDYILQDNLMEYFISLHE